MALTDKQYATLNVFYKQPDCELVARTPDCTQEVATKLKIGKPATHQRLQREVRNRNLKLIKPSPNAKRIDAIRLTAKGKREVERKQAEKSSRRSGPRSRPRR